MRPRVSVRSFFSPVVRARLAEGDFPRLALGFESRI